MRKILFLFIIVSTGAQMNAQIQIQEYRKQLSCDVDKVDELEPVAAKSECGPVKVTFNDVMFSGGCLGTLARTYTFTDDCGNTGVAEQYINLKDLTPPLLKGVPQNQSASKNDLPIVAVVTASDNVEDSHLEVVFEETKTENKVIRTWSVTDKCGNTTSQTQTISLKRK